jgi:uncharacterized protein YdhG (YjbR/CyaY superfamily)
MEKKTYHSIDEYIALYPPDVQKKLQEMRAVIQSCAPEATEKISYQMPTFYLNGNLVYFAAFKDHISLFPTPSGTEAFKKEIASYFHAKGTIQFPLDRPMPMDLVRKIVKFRVAENLKKAEAKKTKIKKK